MHMLDANTKRNLNLNLNLNPNHSNSNSNNGNDSLPPAWSSNHATMPQRPLERAVPRPTHTHAAPRPPARAANPLRLG